MKDSQTRPGNSQTDQDIETGDTQASSGSYYYDDTTGYEPYDAEDDDDDRESVTKDR